MKRVMITGAKGQLGTEVVRQCLGHYDVRAFDRSSLNVASFLTVAQVITMHQPDVVINCAAYTNVDMAEEERRECFRVNAIAPKFMAKACQKIGARLIHISTDYIFGGSHYLPIQTHCEAMAESYYGVSKYLGSVEVMNNCNDYYIVRTCGLYSHAGKNFVNAIIRKAMQGEELSVVDDQTVGAPTYVPDIAEEIVNLIESDESSRIHHIVNSGVCTWFEFAQHILEVSGFNVPLKATSTEELDLRAPRPVYSALDPTIRLRDYRDALVDFWHSR